MSEAKWYVVHTYSGYENKVASSLEAVIENRNLRDMIQDVKIPVETVVEIKPIPAEQCYFTGSCKVFYFDYAVWITLFGLSCSYVCY